ncbi:MAG: 2-C-methyl-D-erythritol 4-phosphate cytidylyltransferase [Isosphaeraceae bacterium]
MARFAVILPAAGRSSRFGDSKRKKVFAELDGRAVWLRAVEPFVNRDDVGQILVVIAPEDRELFELRYRPSVAFLGIQVVEGGAERHDSIASGLALLKPDCDHVAIHDAARPCLTTELIDALFAAAEAHGAALPAVPVSDTVKRVDDGKRTIETVPRRGLYLAQTPQVFRRDLIERAYAERSRLETPITDDTQLVEALGHPCAVVESTPMNLKITTAEDLRLASAILQARPAPKPAGSAHPFADEQARWGDLPRINPKDLFR